MRKEIENWWRQAEKDLEKAQWLSAGGHFDGTALYCQQAVEKALKALILRTSREKKIEGHSLVYLAKRPRSRPVSFRVSGSSVRSISSPGIPT